MINEDKLLINENENFEPPNEINVDNHLFTFKQKLAKNNYSYRCKFRGQCTFTITITKDNLELLKKDKSIKNLKYKISSGQKEHTCQPNKNDKNSETASIINSSNTTLRELAKKLILNLEKPFSWHKTNLEKNKILLSSNQIKKLLQVLRETDLPNDLNFLNDISKIKINLGNTHILSNIPFCHENVNYINF